MYWLARTYKLERFPSTAAALTFAFSPILVFRLKHLNMIQVAIWLPAAWSIIKLIIAEKDKRKLTLLILYLSLIWTLQILAGHPHMAYFCGIASVFYLATLLIGQNWTVIKRSVIILSISVIFSLTLCCIQLWPTYDLIQQSNRSQAESYERLSKYPFSPSHLLTLINPFFFENPAYTTPNQTHINIQEFGVFWEYMAYIGLVPLFVIPLAFYKNERQELKHITALSCIFLLLAMGPKGQIYWLLWKFIPGVDLFRFPARFLLAFSCSISILFGLGLQNLLQKLNTHKYLPILIIGIIFANFYWSTNKYVTYLPSSVLSNTPQAASLLSSSTRVATPDLAFDWTYLVQTQGWSKVPARVTSLLHCLTLDSCVFWDIANQGSHTIWEGGISTLPYFNLQTLLQNMLPKAKSNYTQPNVLKPEATFLYDMQNVDCLLSLHKWLDTNGKELPLIAREQLPDLPTELNIYKLGPSRPRIYLLPNFKEITEEIGCTDFIQTFYQDIINERCILQGDKSDYSTNAPLSDQEYCQIVKNTPCEIEVETKTNSERILYFPENFCRGWNAEIDGQSQKIYRANFCFMACKITPGQHKIKIYFFPNSFKYGAYVSLVGLGILLFLFIGTIVNRKR